jgi:hypothetical protein
MPRLMYDSVNPFAIPAHAQMVLVYVDGIYKWSQAGRDRFKHATQVTCSAVGAVTAQVGDVEVGCIWPVENAVGWVQRARRDGYDPTVYINQRNDWGPCRDAFRRAGVAEPHWFVANYDGVREIPAGSIGKQYAHPSSPPGNPTGPWHTAGHWDESWIADHWPGVDDRAPGGGAGEEDPMAGITIQQIEDAAYAAVTNALDQASNGVNKTAYWAFNKILGDHAVGPIRGTLAELTDDEAKIIEAVRTTANSPIDVDALADQLATKLGPELGAELLTKMSERLAS